MCRARLPDTPQERSFVMLPRILGAVWALLLLTAPSANAQGRLPLPWAIVFAEGDVEVARRAGVQTATAPDVLEDGDRLLTAGGRAELALADGALVHVDRTTDVRIEGSGLLQIVRGRLTVGTTDDGDALDVVTPAGVVRLDPGGEYELGAADLDGDTYVVTRRGRSTLGIDGAAAIEAGTQVHIDPRARQPRWGRAEAPDDFTRWSAVSPKMWSAPGRSWKS